MRWLLRFLVWGTLLVVPCRLASTLYQETLGVPSQAILRALGDPVALQAVDIFAPVDLGVFAAMCLATVAAPPRVRGRAFLLGAAVLVALEIAQIVLGVHLQLSRDLGFRHQSTSTEIEPLLQATIWLAPAILWTVLLAHHELLRAPGIAGVNGTARGRPGDRPPRPEARRRQPGGGIEHRRRGTPRPPQLREEI